MTTGDLGTVAMTGTQTVDPTALAVWTAALIGLVMVALSVHLLRKPGPKLFGPTQERDLSFGAHDVVAALLLMLVVGGLAMDGVVHALRLTKPDDVGSDPDGIFEISHVLLAQALTQIPLALYFLARVVSSTELAPRPRTAYASLAGMVGRGLAWGAAMFFVVLIVSGFCVELAACFGMPHPETGHPMLDVLARTKCQLVTVSILISAILIAPVLEETIYRGVMQSSFVAIMGGQRSVAVVMTSLLFTGIHITVVPPPLLPGIFLLSVVLGWLYERNGHLLAPILAHALFNGLNLLASSGLR